MRIVSTLLLSAASSVSCLAGVTFNFDYTDAPGFTGNTLAQGAVTSAANTIASYFSSYNATINIAVTSSNANNSTLASAGSNYGSFPGVGFVDRGIVGTKILGGTDANAGDADGVMNVNFFHNWSFTDEVLAGEIDFKSTIMHELLHAVGFASSINQDGSDTWGNGIGAVDSTWEAFDQFIADSTGALIDATTFAIDVPRWNAASVGGTATGLFFIGPNAVAANGGQPINIYSPGPWEGGSSGSHLDDEFYTSDNLLMEAATGDGLGARELTAFEIGILKDIGFTNVSAVPEPAAIALLMGGFFLIGAASRRRRRQI